MSIAMLHTADDVWLVGRCAVPMSPDRARDNLHALLRVLDTSAAPEELTREQRARLVNYILDTFDAYPQLAPKWQAAWKAKRPGPVIWPEARSLNLSHPGASESAPRDPEGRSSTIEGPTQ